MRGTKFDFALVLAVSALRATPVAASGPAHVCIEAHALGQIERDEGRLLSAREQFSSCTSEQCPPMIRRECVDLGESVVAMTPSVVLVAQDSEGRVIPGARATIDGTRVLAVLDGRPLELDPGIHEFELGLLEGRSQTVRVTLSSGEKYRRIVASFAAPAPPEPRPAPRPAPPQSPEPDSHGRHPLAYVFGGVGVVALGAWGIYALDGRSRQDELERCAPHCQQSQVDAMRKSYLIADVLLAVSLVSLGTGTYFFFKQTAEPTPLGSASTLWLHASGRF
ncbi:MAG TPA: hypothetical protein VFK05_30830 [Polyangiaceae bacterium]|nr:hypothetical protein [Polyangiaceae bacterium]